MTTKDLVALSSQIAAFLQRLGRPLPAGDLLRRFCRSNPGVRLADAEIALSLLLNQRQLVVDEDLNLEGLSAAA